MNLQIQRRLFFKWGDLGVRVAWLARPVSAQSQSIFVDMAVTPTDRVGRMLDLMGKVTSFGDAPVFVAPPEPDKTLYVAPGATRTGGLYARTQELFLKTSGRLSPRFDTSSARGGLPLIDMALTPSGFNHYTSIQTCDIRRHFLHDEDLRLPRYVQRPHACQQHRSGSAGAGGFFR